MAITKTLRKTQPGFTGELTALDAYWKVLSVTGNKENVAARVGAFVDKQQVHEMSVAFAPAIGDFNFIQQTYVYLKTLPEFAGAVDC
jgi:putative heme degradation protein